MALAVSVIFSGAAYAQNGTTQDYNGVSLNPQVTAPGQTSTQTNANREDSSGAPGDTGQMMQDKLFVKHAMQGSLSEVKLSQLALAKSENEDVKNFAHQMLTDHFALARAWRPLVSSLGVAPVREMTKDQKREYDKLSALSGDAFDKAFISAMLEDHHEDLKLFRDATIATADPTVKDAAVKGLPVVEDHAGQVDELARKNGVTAKSGAVAMK